jgi:hypothetical protein
VSGTKKNLDAALRYVAQLGMEAEPLAQDVQWRQERCIECTACTSICPPVLGGVVPQLKSLGAERCDGFEPRGAGSRIDPEENSEYRRKPEGDGSRGPGDDGLPVSEEG